MGRKKGMIGLVSLCLGTAGCGTLNPPNPKGECEYVERVFGDYKFRSCRESLDDKVLDEFRLVADVKEYSKNVFEFGDTPNYKDYRDGKSVPEDRHYRLYVSLKNMLPEKWQNYVHVRSYAKDELFVTGPTIFFSKGDDLLDEKKFFEDAGYDVFWRSYVNYGDGCGLTPDLINSRLE